MAPPAISTTTAKVHTWSTISTGSSSTNIAAVPQRRRLAMAPVTGRAPYTRDPISEPPANMPSATPPKDLASCASANASATMSIDPKIAPVRASVTASSSRPGARQARPAWCSCTAWIGGSVEVWTVRPTTPTAYSTGSPTTAAPNNAIGIAAHLPRMGGVVARPRARGRA